MPLGGGAPTRLTYDGDSAQVQGWTPDGRVIYNSSRQSGKPDLRPVHHRSRETRREEHPLARSRGRLLCRSGVVFTRRGALGDNVKGYRGGLAQNIWRYDDGKEAVPLTKSYAGTSRQPMCAGEWVYFLSDRDGTSNLWSMNRTGQDFNSSPHIANSIFAAPRCRPTGKRSLTSEARISTYSTSPEEATLG